MLLDPDQRAFFVEHGWLVVRGAVLLPRVRELEQAVDAITSHLVHQAAVTSAAFSPDGKRVVTASEDTTARVWDTATGEVAASNATVEEVHEHESPWKIKLGTRAMGLQRN